MPVITAGLILEPRFDIKIKKKSCLALYDLILLFISFVFSEPKKLLYKTLNLSKNGQKFQYLSGISYRYEFLIIDFNGISTGLGLFNA